MSKKRKNGIMEKLGLESTDQVTIKVCMDRVRTLEKRIEAGAYDKAKGDLRRYAVYYKNWYAWKARQLKKANGKKRAA